MTIVLSLFTKRRRSKKNGEAVNLESEFTASLFFGNFLTALRVERQKRSRGIESENSCVKWVSGIVNESHSVA